MLVLMRAGVAERRAARRTRSSRAARRCLATAEYLATAEAAEAFLLSAAGAEDEQAAAEAIRVLAADGGCPAPVDSPLIEGVWQLCFTSKSKFDIRNPLGARVDGSAPGLEALFRLGGGGGEAASSLQASSSPIQRAIVTNPAFTVTQTVALRDTTVPVVDNNVCFGTSAELLLRASASLPETSDRRRIDFTFESGSFTFRELPVLGTVCIPYPVPFKLLGDEAKGWLDTVYLSPRLRVSIGNKGTTFVLRRPQI